MRRRWREGEGNEGRNKGKRGGERERIKKKIVRALEEWVGGSEIEEGSSSIPYGYFISFLKSWWMHREFMIRCI